MKQNENIMTAKKERVLTEPFFMDDSVITITVEACGAW